MRDGKPATYDAQNQASLLWQIAVWRGPQWSPQFNARREVRGTNLSADSSRWQIVLRIRSNCQRAGMHRLNTIRDRFPQRFLATWHFLKAWICRTWILGFAAKHGR